MAQTVTQTVTQTVAQTVTQTVAQDAEAIPAVHPSHAIAMHGEPKYDPGFTHFDYLDPDAPKGGRIKLGAQGKLQNQERETPREYLDRESHFVWGNRLLLQVVETQAAPCVELKRNKLVLSVRPGTDVAKKQAIVEGWHRNPSLR